MNELDELRSELRSRSQDMYDGHPIDMDDVRSRARRIRTRRRLASGAVAAAVLGVAVPTAFAVNGTLLSGQEVGPANPSPSVLATPTPTETSAPRPDGEPGPLTTVDIPRGEDPGIAFIRGNTLVQPDGSTVTLDRSDYAAVTPYGPGWVASRYGDAGSMVFLDADGTTLRTQPGSNVVVNAVGTQIAYVTAAESTSSRPQLVFAPTNGAESAKAQVDVPDGAVPVGFVAEDTVVYNTRGVEPVAGLVRADGSGETVRGLLTIEGATEVGGLVTGVTSIDELEPGSCSVVMEVATGRQAWETCDFTLGRFSPDGRYVLGHPQYRDGIGDGEVAILDAATGEVLAHLRSQGGNDTFAFVSNVVWEDESHVLASVYQDGTWTLVRVGADGSVEAATERVPGGDMDPTFRLSVQP